MVASSEGGDIIHESDVVELFSSHQAMTDAQGFTRAR
jgi:hypothetical protein